MQKITDKMKNQKQTNQKQEYRLLLTEHNTGAMNMAIDESVLHHVSKGISPPTLRLYGWKPTAITIGYFQSMKEEVDFGKCKELGVDTVRRITGGGAVFHDSEVTYSIIAPERYFSNDILASYKQICDGIIKGLKKLGLEACFVPLNDIIVNGKKISGNAQTRRMKCILQHGTILIDVDVKKMFSLLLVPDEKIKDKLIKNVQERVTSINKETEKKGKSYGFKAVVKSLVEGFKESLNSELELGELSAKEKEMAQMLAKDKFSTKKWNCLR